MSFKITVEKLPLRVEFEVGSLSEAIAALQEEDSNLRKITGLADSLNNDTGTVETGEAGPRRGRKPKGQPDPSTAAAPPPAPIPAAPAAPPSPTEQVASADGDTRKPAADAPLAPPPPPAPSIAPPSGILAGKIIADLDKRKSTAADGGKQLADWLAAYGIVQAGASYDEAIAVVRLQTDAKLSQVATALSIA